MLLLNVEGQKKEFASGNKALGQAIIPKKSQSRKWCHVVSIGCSRTSTTVV